MTVLFDELCKGPVIIVDNEINKKTSGINKIIKAITNKQLPVLTYKAPSELMKVIQGFTYANFLIMDWDFSNGKEKGATAKQMEEEEVINAIVEFRKISLAPVFILSKTYTGHIEDKLYEANIKDVYVIAKHDACESENTLFSIIDKWIAEHPHVYLTKCWINEWLKTTAQVFWDLHELNSSWPNIFHESFKKDGVDPLLALRDILFQLIFSQVNISNIKSTYLSTIEDDVDIEALRELYQRLIYVRNDINNDIRPGDIFRIESKNQSTGEVKYKYYLNIRPECDTTARIQSNSTVKAESKPNPRIYVLEGEPKSQADVNWDKKYKTIIDKETEITLPLLDNNDFVVFYKRSLEIKKYSTLKEYKICRVIRPHITKIRQSYTGFLGRSGIPAYPKEIIESLFTLDE
ncbi:hypothetical protein ACFLW2_02995 [Chloroflexota bacterium]